MMMIVEERGLFDQVLEEEKNKVKTFANAVPGCLQENQLKLKTLQQMKK